MINLILHTMKKKEQMLEFLNMLGNVLEKSLKELKENGHHFDANSEECKGCESFAICKEFTGMLKAISDSDYDKDVKTDMAAFIIFMKKRISFVDDFDVEDVIKNDEEYCISGYYKRFDSVIKGFKHYDKLVEILNDNQLNLLRKIVLDVTNDIEDLMNTIADRNRSECNTLINKLRKPQQEEKSYEDITKEELIALLNNK